MEMYPYNPLVQFCEGHYKKKLYIKASMHNFNLKIITINKCKAFINFCKSSSLLGLPSILLLRGVRFLL